MISKNRGFTWFAVMVFSIIAVEDGIVYTVPEENSARCSPVYTVPGEVCLRLGCDPVCTQQQLRSLLGPRSSAPRFYLARQALCSASPAEFHKTFRPLLSAVFKKRL